ncbi:hypothetical protein G9A89_008177 [Geosiphon pyriformis]|nr:hypothetical protein G9A89_008177 [Geosiphon pyriformis]
MANQISVVQPLNSYQRLWVQMQLLSNSLDSTPRSNDDNVIFLLAQCSKKTKAVHEK